MTIRPEFRVLAPEDCQSVLERNHVGRIAYMHAQTVDIEPIGYVALGKWVFFRTAPGTKNDALARNPFVAFEVDEVDGPFRWVSVVAHGTVYALPRDGAPIEQREFERAVTAMRTAMPEAFTDADPTPHRELVYGLHVHRMQGRMARS
jgi:nitroimidazol reductase NimA-like FMN-containing flavoprotein (pyridoxamine 5'-phosphate oxidase superfamily)